jgi:hypothetical protein
VILILNAAVKKEKLKERKKKYVRRMSETESERERDGKTRRRQFTSFQLLEASLKG